MDEQHNSATGAEKVIGLAIEMQRAALDVSGMPTGAFNPSAGKLCTYPASWKCLSHCIILYIIYYTKCVCQNGWGVLRRIPLSAHVYVCACVHLHSIELLLAV